MIEDITGLKQAAVQMQELFKTLMEAGFTEDQALKLISFTLAQGMNSGNDS